MIDINKYLKNQIKKDEEIIRLAAKQDKIISKSEIANKPIFKPTINKVLLDKVNADIKNQKILSNHYKSQASGGMPIVEEDNNIRLINNDITLDSSLENQFNFLMSKYIKDATTLTNLQTNLTPEMISELVHNWALYEPDIKKYRGQYVDNKLFLDKIRNMLLSNVNLKYPATRNLNSMMNASNDPALIQQQAIERKNQNTIINPKTASQEALLGNLNFVIKVIGKSEDECNKHYELWKPIFKYLQENFDEITKDDTYKEVINTFKSAMKYYIDTEPEQANEMLNILIGIYTGTEYKNSNNSIPIYIQNLIIPNIDDNSYRTKLILFVNNKWHKAYTESQKKPWFKKELCDEFNNRTSNKSNIVLDEKDNIDLSTFNSISNDELIFFCQIIDKLQTDEELEKNRPIYNIPKPSSYGERSITDLVNLTKDQIIKKIVELCKTYKYTTTNPKFRQFLKNNKIKHADSPTNITNMIKAANLDQLRNLYDNILDDEDPVAATESKEGTGLRPTEKKIHSKYFIDRHKLNNNVLELRYNKNRHLTNVKSQVIGHGVKKILNQIIDHDYIDTSDYHQITEHEQHLIRTILHMLDRSHLIGSANDQFNDKFQILLGSYNAGNNSEQLRSQLKQYIIQAMKLNMITRTTGQQMLLEMCI